MDYKQAIRRAVEAAGEAPEELREAAFRIVLERLLDLEPAQPNSPTGTPAEKPPKHNSWEERLFANLPEGHLVQERGDRKQQTVWAVASLHQRGTDVTSEEIRRLIRTELGIAPQNDQNTARTLRGLTPRYVVRRDRTEGRGYIYEPTARSIEIFEDM